jgi:hypothetical protein
MPALGKLPRPLMANWERSVAQEVFSVTPVLHAIPQQTPWETMSGIYAITPAPPACARTNRIK